MRSMQASMLNVVSSAESTTVWGLGTGSSAFEFEMTVFGVLGARVGDFTNGFEMDTSGVLLAGTFADFGAFFASTGVLTSGVIDTFDSGLEPIDGGVRIAAGVVSVLGGRDGVRKLWAKFCNTC
jgi:hypothetical protein